MQKKFWKMHGIGNDYIYFDCFEWQPNDPASLAITLSDRHFSVGGDGVVLILPSSVADARMRMFNADGSEGKMCGNAIRCIGKFLYEIKEMRKPVLTVETLSGIKTLSLDVSDGVVRAVRVDMGKAELSPARIPAKFEGERVVNAPLSVNGAEYRVTCVSMGNPHCITFVEDPYALDLEKIGPAFERHPAFPERVNTEFVRVDGRNELTMRVWERGSGETWACGTGAAAAAVACVLNGLCKADTDITVKLKGGDLIVRYASDGSVTLTGNVEKIYEGTVEF